MPIMVFGIKSYLSPLVTQESDHIILCSLERACVRACGVCVLAVCVVWCACVCGVHVVVCMSSVCACGVHVVNVFVHLFTKLFGNVCVNAFTNAFVNHLWILL